MGQRLTVGMQLHALLCQGCKQGVQLAEQCFMHEQSVECVAHAHASRLGILYDACRHQQVGRGCHIGMHHAGSRLDDRDARRIAHKLDEALASARYAHIYISCGSQHLGSGLMGGWQQSGSRLWQAVRFQYAVYQCDDGTIGVIGIAAALEHAGVSALQAKREYIETHVGTCLIYHAYYTEGNCLPSQEQSVGQSASLQFDAER